MTIFDLNVVLVLSDDSLDVSDEVELRVIRLLVILLFFRCHFASKTDGLWNSFLFGNQSFFYLLNWDIPPTAYRR